MTVSPADVWWAGTVCSSPPVLVFVGHRLLPPANRSARRARGCYLIILRLILAAVTVAIRRRWYRLRSSLPLRRSRQRSRLRLIGCPPLGGDPRASRPGNRRARCLGAPAVPIVLLCAGATA